STLPPPDLRAPAERTARRLAHHVVPLQAAIECAAADAEHLCGRHTVPADLAEHLHDVLTLELLERGGPILAWLRRVGLRGPGQSRVNAAGRYGMSSRRSRSGGSVTPTTWSR